MTSVAKQPDPVAQSNAFESFDIEMQLPAYQNEGVTLLLESIYSTQFLQQP
jgi:hypothetical protein